MGGISCCNDFFMNLISVITFLMQHQGKSIPIYMLFYYKFFCGQIETRIRCLEQVLFFFCLGSPILHIMFILQFVFWTMLPIILSAEMNSTFLEGLRSYYTFHSAKFNVIICSESEGINLTKMLSVRFRRFVAVHRADEALKPFLDEPQAFILELECPKSIRILKQAETLGLFRKPYQWVLLTDTKSLDATYGNSNQSDSKQTWHWSFLETLSVLTDSDVTVIEKISNERVTLTGVYKLMNRLLKEPLAEWTAENGLTVFNWKPLAVRRWNLQGAVLPSSMIILYPDSVNHFEDFVDIHLDRTTKINYNLIKLYADLFNASVNIKIISDWGVLVNGSWTGMVGEFERKEIEIGGSPLFFQKQRLDFIEYYDIITPNGISFIFLSPPLSSSRNIFVMPFDKIVWYCCLFMVAVSCFLFSAAVNYEKSHYAVEEMKKKESSISFTEILIVNIGAICQQGTVTQTKDPPGRIITLFLYLSYMFLYIAYSGSIVAILQSSDTSIRTLSDFLNSQLKAGAEDVTYNRFYFRIAEDRVRKSIYNKKIAPKGRAPHFLPLEEGIKRVQKGFYGFHVELSVGFQVIQRTFNEEEKCALQVLKETFLQYIEPWLVMKKRSPYAEHLKIGAKKCTETGVKHRFTNRFFTKKPICLSKSSRFVSVGIIDCFYAFMLLTYGFVVAFLIMILEISFHKLSKRRKKQWRIRKEPAPHNVFLN